MDGWTVNFKTGIIGNWPVTPSGEPEEPVFLERKTGSESEIGLEQNMLWAFGVPSLSRYPLDGALGKVVLGQSGFGKDIFVPKSMLEDAKNIISADYSDIENINEEE